MSDVKEFCYSLFRHWRGICIVAIVSVMIGSVGSVLPTLFSEDDSVEASDNLWGAAKTIYAGQLKYVGISNGIVSGEEIRDIYIAKLHSNSFYDYIKTKLFEDNSEEYVQNIIDVGNRGLNTYCGIDFIYYDEEVCENILKTIMDYVIEQNSVIEEKIGKHQFVLIDEGIKEVEKENYAEKIDEIENKFNKEVSVEDEAKKILSKKNIIMNGLLALIMGEFLYCIYILAVDGLKNTIYSADCLNDKNNIEVLGDFSGISLKGRIDKKLYKFFIGKGKFSREGIARLIGFKMENKFGKSKSYMLVGQCHENKLDEVMLILKNVNGEKMNISQSMLIDESAKILEKWNIENKIIYVSTRFKENKKEVKENIKLFEELGFEIAGVIFV